MAAELREICHIGWCLNGRAVPAITSQRRGRAGRRRGACRVPLSRKICCITSQAPAAGNRERPPSGQEEHVSDRRLSILLYSQADDPGGSKPCCGCAKASVS